MATKTAKAVNKLEAEQRRMDNLTTALDFAYNHVEEALGFLGEAEGLVRRASIELSITNRQVVEVEASLNSATCDLEELMTIAEEREEEIQDALDHLEDDLDADEA